MAGFSLGSGSRPGGEEEQQIIPPETLFNLYSTGSRPSSSTNLQSRGFELWQSNQLQIERQQQHQLYPHSSGLLTFSNEPVLQVGDGRSIGFSMRASASSGSISCQDCGNQAKKDCDHLRCRTCCKSRGFQCSTHVKSTWVAASKRRERAQQLAAAAAIQQQPSQQQPLRIDSSEPSKRPRAIVPAQQFPTAIATTTSSGEGLIFPPELSSPAVFKCVRVSSMDDAEDQYAYQTAVNIGGHLFKGLLYDHGPEGPYSSPSVSTARGVGESSSSSAAAAIVTTAASIGAVPTSSVATAGLIDPASLYPTPLSAFMAGTQFFPHHQGP